MLDSDINRLRGEADTYGITLPKALRDADKLVDAAQELLTEVTDEQAPDPEAFANRAQLRRLHEGLCLWSTHDERLAHARRLHTIALSKRAAAWDGAVPALLEAFRDPFDTTVAAFLSALDQIGGNYDTANGAQRDTLDALANPITSLAAIRDILGTQPVDLGNSMLTRITRVMRFTDLERAGRVYSISQGGAAAAYWAEVSKSPGTVIRWNVPAEQQTQAQLGTRATGSREKSFATTVTPGWPA